MTASEFTDFLVAEIKDGNADFVIDLLAAAKAKITAGGGQIAPLISGALNGKSFNRELSMDAAVVAKCCRDAIRETADEGDKAPVSSTGLDFSGLNT